MNRLTSFLLASSLLVALLQVTFADPTAKFTPPSDGLTVGKEFVAKCTLGGFVPAEVPDKNYLVMFYYIYLDKTTNPNETPALLATYTVAEGK